MVSAQVYECLAGVALDLERDTQYGFGVRKRLSERASIGEHPLASGVFMALTFRKGL